MFALVSVDTKVEAIADAVRDLPIGAYANAGRPDERIGWQSSAEPGADKYAEFARQWIDAGATLIGGCCGTGPAHIVSLRKTISSATGVRNQKK